MTETLTSSCVEFVSSLLPPENFIGVATQTHTAFLDFGADDVASQEDTDDLADLRATRTLYEDRGLTAFVALKPGK